MTENIYKLVELVGSSSESISDAIQNAIARASTTIRNVRWFEVVQIRGGVEDGVVAHYQVTIKVGFTLEEAG
jgi:flavin-binding protein dodecin